MQDLKRLVATAAVGVALTVSAFYAPVDAQGRRRPAPVMSQKYEEPAFARGYAAGRELGLSDARNGERYDPVGSREYRDGDHGYDASYGSRDAYRSNYRAGFRQGYEEGYRKN
jgi:hypothetical protein